ncbi:MAG TPA: ribonuclease Y [Sedimentisphaerales bacterium]|nr:ribonuclease Y [Sedimentisphaerales bacterium]
MDAVLMQIPFQAGVAGVVCFILGACFWAIIVQIKARTRAKTIGEELQRQREGATREADNIIKTAQIEAAAEAIKKKEEFTIEANRIRAELRESEMRLSKREDVLERQTNLMQEQEKNLKAQEQECERRIRNADVKDKQLTVLIAQQKNQLLKITGMQIEEARQLLLKRLEDECEHEMSSLIQRKVEEAKEVANDKCREVISTAIQRYAAEQTCEVTVSTVEIPNDDMKGRIIGREGRNIRAFEKATGVDVIVDDTPGMVVVSGFNPVRREVARLSMERLIQDGRIHPSRIEELVAQTKNEVNHKVLQVGKDATVETNIRGLPNKLLSLLGALSFRTSYGQNVLRHSVEVAFLSQAMADELGLDGSLARRAGLLHDIGKAIDHDVEGNHPTIGANFLKRFNESPVVLNVVAGHHGDVPPDNPYTPLVAAADAMSASRPGARRETLERYIKRLEKLEEIATSFKGVETAYAIQAGREIRVIVDANQIDDEYAMKVARDIATKVEQEMTYPGEIQVTLLREVRCIEYAK